MKDKLSKNFEHFGLQYIILRIIFSRPSYGYELTKKIKKLTDRELKPKAGTVYVTLKRMDEKKLVISKIKESKKIYRITKKGEKYLEIWLEKIVKRKKIIDNIIKFYKLNFKNK